jgi:hypothetical protein
MAARYKGKFVSNEFIQWVSRQGKQLDLSKDLSKQVKLSPKNLNKSKAASERAKKAFRLQGKYVNPLLVNTINQEKRRRKEEPLVPSIDLKKQGFDPEKIKKSGFVEFLNLYTTGFFDASKQIIKTIKAGNTFVLITEDRARLLNYDGLEYLEQWEQEIRKESYENGESPIFIHTFKVKFEKDEKGKLKSVLTLDLKDTEIRNSEIK